MRRRSSVCSAKRPLPPALSRASAPASGRRLRRLVSGLSPLPRGRRFIWRSFPTEAHGQRHEAALHMRVGLSQSWKYTYIHYRHESLHRHVESPKNQVRTACCRHHRKWLNTSPNIEYSQCVLFTYSVNTALAMANPVSYSSYNTAFEERPMLHFASIFCILGAHNSPVIIGTIRRD